MKFFKTLIATDNIKSEFENTKVLLIQPKNLKDVDLSNYYKTLAKYIGVPIIYEENPITGEILHNEWTKIEYLKGEEKNTYKHSNLYQPLHTDYGYFSFEIFCSFFYCEKQAAFGGATTFIDVDKVVETLSILDKNLFQNLCKTKINFGRKGNPVAHNTDYVLQKDDLGWKINWNYYRAFNNENNNLVGEFKQFLDNHIEKSGELLELKLQPGEAVFFHDRRVLHGRNSFLGNRLLNKGAITKEIPEYVLKLFSK